MYRLEAVSHDRFVRLIPYLKYRNANDAHVYLKPTGESAYTLLDDLTESTLGTLTEAGYGPAAVIETSHGSFPAWLRHEQPLYKELGTLAAKSLAARFGADSSAADWRRFGRAQPSQTASPNIETHRAYSVRPSHWSYRKGFLSGFRFSGSAS